MGTTRKFFYYGKFGVFGIIALVAITFVVMWLWNWLVPELFKGPELTYWQTLGILVLSKIIFTGIGGGRGHGDHEHKHHPWGRHPREDWKRKFGEKMNGIADKEQEGEEDTSK